MSTRSLARLAIATVAAFAQANGTIHGTVVPAVSVTADDLGQYAAPVLPVGSYSVRVEKADRVSALRDRTLARKAMLVPCAAGAVCVLLVPSATTPERIVALLCAAMGLFTAATPVFSGASLDLAPEFAGVLASLQNAFANLAGNMADTLG